MKTFNRGFTLMEIIVVIGIIAMLAAITTASMSGAREHSRDSSRIADLGQIALGFKLYANKNATYPDRTSPVLINNDSALSKELLKHIPAIPEGEFSYDAAYNCGGRTIPVVYTKLEKLERGNRTEVCGVNTHADGIYLIPLE